MGYFANGTEGEMFHERNCAKCLHWREEGPMCPVLSVHHDWNYAQYDRKDGVDTPEAKRTKAILDVLIPPSKCGLYNGRCAMLIEREQ